MAAPHNLTLHTSFSSNNSQQQSLQTPDSNTLFASSLTPISQSLSNVPSVNSLEELLSFTGVTNETSAATKQNGQLKRHFGDNFTEGPVSKKIKIEEETPSVQMHIPSISPHTTSTASLPYKLPPPQANSGMILPLINPLTSMVSTASGIKIPPLLGPPLSQSFGSGAVDGTSTSMPSTSSESVALMVQLYKHYQSVGDSVGMSKVHQQLLALHSQLASKAGTYLNSLATINSTNTNPTAGAVMSSTTTVADLSKKPVSLVNSLSVPGYNSANNQPGLNHSLHKSQAPITGLNVSTVNQLSSFGISNNSSISPSALNPQPTSTTSNAVNSTTNSIQQGTLNNSGYQLLTTGLNATQSGNSGGSNNSIITNNSSLLNGTTLKQPHNDSNLLQGLQTNPNLSPNLRASTSQANSLNLATQSSVVSSQMSSPSIVTHSLSSTPSSGGITPLAGLQVTAQTQANVLRAVYSYRLQQIQDFLASLPAGQRPTTTQELRDLLTKHNILAKALPPDFVANLQKQLPVQSSPGQSITTAAPVATSVNHSSAGAQSHAATATSTPPTTNVTSGGPGLLPGVTLETLRTLCRLPEAELVRIPMPSMLLTVVQYMRANKWNGNSTELPSLIQQAQEALAKGTLIAATPQPPFQTNSTGQKTSSQLTTQNTQPLKVTSTASIQQQKMTTSSPLSQYMASVGIKLPTSSANSTTDFSNKFTIGGIKSTSTTLNKQTTSSQATTSRPATRFHNKALQEQAEKERLSALQKVLQSSEEARIAFRFQAHLDKLHQQINSCEIQRPFSTWHDLILRLLPYHIYREPELPQGAMEKADAVYEGIAGVLLSRSQGLMNQYQQMLLREEQRTSEDEYASFVLERLWLDGERERKEEEERQKKEAEQIAAELSAVGRAGNSSFFDSDPFLLESDSYLDDSFLDSFWSEFNDGLSDTDFDLGIT